MVYWLIVQHGWRKYWWPTSILAAIGFAVRMLALYRGWKEQLA